jgi:hypothetical protein
MNAIEKLPLPYWLTYGALFIIQGVLLHAIAWYDGMVPVYKIDGINLLYPLWLWVPLAIMTYLDQTALEAISSFGPLISEDDEAIAPLRHEFTNMPNRGAITSAIIWSILFVIFLLIGLPPLLAEYEPSPFVTGFSIIMGLIPFTVGSTIYYHSIRQLRLVSRTVKVVKHFNLFQLDPVYAFSRLTARTGIAWVFLSTFTLIIVPAQLAAPILTMVVSQILVAVIVFVLPLWNVHQRLVIEKRNLQSKLNQRVESVLAQLHRGLDENVLGEIADINSALAGLEAEREVLSRIPTWPWRPRTLTGFLSLIVLPLLLFLVQLAIENWLSR